jgi:hypothetical protein
MSARGWSASGCGCGGAGLLVAALLWAVVAAGGCVNRSGEGERVLIPNAHVEVDGMLSRAGRSSRFWTSRTTGSSVYKGSSPFS